MVLMRWGMPPPPRTGGRHVPTSAFLVAALARLAQAGEPVLGPGEQLAEYAPEPNPETKKKTWCSSQ
jgi:hypothetical protein